MLTHQAPPPCFDKKRKERKGFFTMSESKKNKTKIEKLKEDKKVVEEELAKAEKKQDK